MSCPDDILGGPDRARRRPGRLSCAWFQNLNWDAEITSLAPGEAPLYPAITQAAIGEGGGGGGVIFLRAALLHIMCVS